MPREASSLTAIPKESMRDRVLRALRSAIVSGEMEPGRVYSAPYLAGRFGVSATPVREAMLDLARENMVTIVPNKGFRVTEVDDATLDQITQIRQLLEPPVVARVTPIIPEADLGELRRLAEQIVSWAKASNLVEYTEADRVFHLKLLSYAGNPRLVELVSDLRAQTRLLNLTTLLEQGRLTEAAEEHLTIVELIRARDVGAVEAYLRRHLGQVRTTWARQPGQSRSEPAS
ncbi:MAG TPA: GntR family transcriptional regulator [Candidatus Nanopelagicales bacterium]|nr:GntR family transcriptional regulator [Candidatus Nanopelagicales bacterium]